MPAAVVIREAIDVPDDPRDIRREIEDARGRFPGVIPLDTTVLVYAAGREHLGAALTRLS